MKTKKEIFELLWVKNKRKTLIIGFIVVFLVIGGFIAYRTIAFNKNFSSAEKSFAQENYPQAALEYEKALSYRNDPSIKEKIQLSKDLDASLTNFKNGNTALKEKSYRSARDYFAAVNNKDTKRYAEAQAKLIESTNLYIQQEFKFAKDGANQNDYYTAIYHANNILEVDKNNKEATMLLTQYKAAQKNKENQTAIASARKIIRINSVYSDKPNSAGGVNLHVDWTNKSNKTIKYATFEVIPYNAVGDVQKCSIRGYSNFQGQETGPIEPGAKSGNGYRWENAWYNYTIVKVKLISINIEYMDGSTERLDETQCSYVIY